jgi:ABC-type multidrug transport system fused ATPase/permease subunit
MLEDLLLWLAVAFVIVALLAAAAFLVARWLFVRAAERVAHSLDQRVGGAAAQALTRLGAYARATGIDLAEADRRFGLYIDRSARLLDSAVTLPLLGPVGLDAALSMVPIVGDLFAGAMSLTLVARSLRYGPPAALVSKMLANVLTDVIIGAIPVVGVLGDVWFRANDRNAQLLRTYLEQRPGESSSVSNPVDGLPID